MERNIVIKQECLDESYSQASGHLLNEKHDVEISTRQIKVEPLDDGYIYQRLTPSIDDNTDAYTDSSDNENTGQEVRNDNTGQEVRNENTGQEVRNENTGQEFRNENTGQEFRNDRDLDHNIRKAKKEGIVSVNAKATENQNVNKGLVNVINSYNPDDVYEDDSDESIYITDDDDNVVYEESTDPFDSDDGSPDILTKIQAVGKNLKDENQVLDEKLKNNGNKYTDHCINDDKKLKSSVSAADVKNDCDVIDNVNSVGVDGNSDDEADNENSDKEMQDEDSKKEKKKSSIKTSFIHSMKQNLFLSPYKIFKKERMNEKCDNLNYSKLSCNSSAGFGPYKCQICGKRYGSRAQLKDHTSTHTKDCVSVTGKQDIEKCDTLKKDGESSSTAKLIQNDSETVSESEDNNNITNEGINTVFRCDMCTKEFCKKQLLHKHFRSKHAQNLNKCEVCAKTFCLKKNLNCHLRKCHPESVNCINKYTCNICDKEFGQKNNLNQHIRGHKEMAPYNCDFCDSRFFAKHNLQDHIMQKHSHEDKNIDKNDDVQSNTEVSNESKEAKSDFKCSFCNKMFQSERSLERHVSGEHIDNSSFKCEICKELFVTDNDLKCHLSTHTYKCEKCTKVYKTKAALEKHVRIKHSVNAPYTCTVCDKGFFAEYNLSQHAQEHSLNIEIEGTMDSELFECDLCNLKVKSKEMLNEHLQTHSESKVLTTSEKEVSQSQDISKSYDKSVDKNDISKGKNEDQNLCKCKVCKKEFINKKTRNEHIRFRHPNHCAFMCDQCNKGFFRETFYEQHMRKHNSHNSKKKEQHQSDTNTISVNRGFEKKSKDNDNDKSNLMSDESSESHKKITQDKKDLYKCEKCSKKFKTKERMDKHYRIKHVQNAPYACTICNTGFFAHHNLQQHLQEHKDNQMEKETFNREKCNKTLDSLFLLEENHSCCLESSEVKLEHEVAKDTKHNVEEQMYNTTEQQSCDKEGTVSPEHNAPLKTNTQDSVLKVACDSKLDKNGPFKNKFSEINMSSGETIFPNSEPLFICKVCNKTFKRKKYLQFHFRKIHANNERFQCRICGKGFSWKGNYLNHQKVHSSEEAQREIVETPVCRENKEEVANNLESDKVDLTVCQENQKDVASNLESDKVDIKVCQENRKDVASNLESGKGKVDFNTVKCEICDVTFSSRKTFQFHFKTHHADQMPFQCKKCYKGFFVKYALKKHVHNSKHFEILSEQTDSSEIDAKQGRKDSLSNENLGENNGEKMNISCGKAKISDTRNEDGRVLQGISDKMTNQEIQKNSTEISPEVAAVQSVYKCSICPKQCSDKEAITKHHKRHLSKKAPFICRVCDYGFFNESHFEKHVYSHDDFEPDEVSGKTYECDKCSKTFESEMLLLEHLKKHKINEKYVCHNCKREFWLEKTLKQHVCGDVADNKKNDIDYKKNMDKDLSEQIKSVESGEDNFSSKGVKMEVVVLKEDCQELTANKETPELSDNISKEITTDKIESNMNIESENKDSLESTNNLLKCSICDSHFADEKELKKHGESHKNLRQNIFSVFSHKLCYSSKPQITENPREPDFECSICHIKFIYKQNLDNHILMHKDKVHSCDICQKKFKHFFIMQRHKHMKHGKRSEFDLMSKNCNSESNQKMVSLDEQKAKKNVLQSKASLEKSPSKRMSDAFKSIDKPFICNFCENGFRTNEELDCHIHIHTKEEPYKCGFCGKAFKDMKSMLIHMKKHECHEKSEEYKCFICSKKYGSFQKLRKHLSNCSLSGVKCEVCSKQFSSQAHLKRHSFIHLGIKPFECTICGDEFTRSDHLKKHKEKHHVNISEGKKSPHKKIEEGKSVKKCIKNDESRLQKDNINEINEKPCVKKRKIQNQNGSTCLSVKQFKCRQCTKLFRFKFSLKKHIEGCH